MEYIWCAQKYQKARHIPSTESLKVGKSHDHLACCSPLSSGVKSSAPTRAHSSVTKIVALSANWTGRANFSSLHSIRAPLGLQAGEQQGESSSVQKTRCKSWVIRGDDIFLAWGSFRSFLLPQLEARLRELFMKS